MTTRGVGRTVKTLARALLGRAGLELRRHRGPDLPARSSLTGALGQVAAVGWEPATCIDVGAAFGDFTLACASVFPRAHYLMIEPLEEYRPHLEAVRRRVAHASYAACAAAARAGEATLHVHADLVGSSLLIETEGGGVDGVPRRVPAATVDELCRVHGATGPCLIKADVQGAELTVLQGATDALARAEYVILETSLFRFFVDGLELPTVIAFMAARGFVPYDVIGLRHRPLDGALAQLDMAFVRDAGPFRRHHAYATSTQRAAQDAAFAAATRRRRQRLQETRP